MCQDKSPISKYIGKPYEPMGQGNPGYDCVTLTLAILKEYKGFIPDEDILNNYIDVWKGTNLSLVMQVAPKYCDQLWYGDSRDFNPSILQPFDIIVFRMFGNPTHLGIYIGNNNVLTTKQNSISDTISLGDRVYSKMICSVFRLKEGQ